MPASSIAASAFEGEAYWRIVSRTCAGPNTGPAEFHRPTRHRLQARNLGDGDAARVAQIYLSGSKIFGEFRRPVGLSRRRELLPVRKRDRALERGVSVRARRSPVGALSLPVLVGGNGAVLLQQLHGELLKRRRRGAGRARSDDVLLDRVLNELCRRFDLELRHHPVFVEGHRSRRDVQVEHLQAYAWPGNVRELRNIIERAVVTATGPILERVAAASVPVTSGRHR